MSGRFESILNNSDDLYGEFIQQQQFCKEITDFYAKNPKIFDAKFEELHLAATDFIHFIYSAPLYQDFFYVHDRTSENVGRQFVVMPSQKEAEDYAGNQQCKMVYFGYDDLLYICKELKVDYIVMFFEEKTLAFSVQEMEYFLTIYQSQNPKSEYIIGKPSESYNDVIQILSDKFGKYNFVKSLWLYHVVELKEDKTAANFDVIVADMPVDDYLLIKSFIENVVYKTNNHSIKVVLKESRFGEFLLETPMDPIFTNN